MKTHRESIHKQLEEQHFHSHSLSFCASPPAPTLTTAQNSTQPLHTAHWQVLVSNTPFISVSEGCVSMVNLLSSRISCLALPQELGSQHRELVPRAVPRMERMLVMQDSITAQNTSTKQWRNVEPEFWFPHSRDTDSLRDESWRNYLSSILVLCKLGTKC